MATSIPTSFNNISLIPGTIIIARKNNLLTRCAVFQKSGRQTLSATPFSMSLLFPHFRLAFDANSKSRDPILSSSKTDVVVEDADPPTVGNNSMEASETSPDSGKQSEQSTPKSNPSPNRASSKRPRFIRKSEMPPVKNEDLIPGATFTGKVISIQPFGAFVDFGAFTDGLVHISNLSDSFVKDIGSVVSIGQEVKVRLLDSNVESGRISLTMREDFETSKSEQPKEASVNNDKSQTPKRSPLTSSQTREEAKKVSKFVKGQDLEGTVKKLTRSGAFISLPEGEEGFLPNLEMDDEGLGSLMGGSSLQVGEEVSVRVLRVFRGQVTLTTKKESAWELDANGQGLIHTATNPFALAFRKNKEISKFLEQREEELAKNSVKDDEKSQTDDTSSETSEKDTQVAETIDGDMDLKSPSKASITTTTDQPSLEPSTTEDELLPKTIMDQCGEEPSALDVLETTANPGLSEQLTSRSFSSESLEKAHNENIHNVNDESHTQRYDSREPLPTLGEEEPKGTDFQSNESTPRVGEQSVASQNINHMAEETKRDGEVEIPDNKASRTTAEGRIGSYIHDGRIGVLIEVHCETDSVSRRDIFRDLVDDLAMQVAACPQVEYLSIEDVPAEVVNKEREIEMQKDDLLSKPENIRAKIVDGRIKKRLAEYALLEQPYIKNDKVFVKDWVKNTIATLGENIKLKRFVRFNLGEGLEKRNYDFAAEVAAQTAARSVLPPAKEPPVAAGAGADDPLQAPRKAISAAMVKQLREETGAGMMDCKKALSETGGDLEKAQDHLRKKGLWSAAKKSGRLAAEGRVGSYTHHPHIGVLIEVNCETDFVGRSEEFKQLVDDLALQVVACPQVEYVSGEDIPAEEEEEERRVGEVCLLEQRFVKDESVLVKDVVKRAVVALGENIKVRRFVRFTLGE